MHQKGPLMTPSALPADDVVPKTVGIRIKQLREARGLTAKEVAGHCDCTPQLVHSWERGNNQNIRALNFVRLCQALNTRPEYLLFGELPIEPPAIEHRIALPVLNSSESPDILEMARAAKALEIGTRFLRALGVLEPGRAAWYFVPGTQHEPQWKIGDAFIVDRVMKPYVRGAWYLVFVDGLLELRQVVGADAARLVLADGAGREIERDADAVIYFGEVRAALRRSLDQWTGIDGPAIATPAAWA